ncbi:hypothetical protein B0H13DRAFT_1867946 [Mycena leptocephala]|nr:hypothetical protein B0H13DRAFT_1867946 [Mycena leptocephala]
MASIRVLGIATRHLERLRSTIIPHMHHIRYLDLRGTPQQLRTLFGPDATMLQSLKFRYDTTYSHQRRFQPPPLGALNLASLDITGGGILGLSDFPVHWEHLTQLRTVGVFCDPLDALRVLPRLTALIEMEISLSDIPKCDRASIVNLPSFNLPHLRAVLLTLHPDAELWLLLSKLTTPLLDSLGVYIHGDLNRSVDHSEELADALLDLYFRSKCTIQRLTLSNVDVDNFLAVDDCPAVFSIISTIRTLRLLRLDIDDIASWLPIFLSDVLLPDLDTLEVEVREDAFWRWEELEEGWEGGPVNITTDEMGNSRPGEVDPLDLPFKVLKLHRRHKACCDCESI